MIKFKIKAPLSNVLSKKEVEDYLNNFKAIDYRQATPGNSGNHLLSILMKIGGGTFMMHSQYIELIVGQKLYRTRPMIKEKLSELKGIREFYSPPKNIVGWGRLNTPQNPMLYAAFDRGTAIMENSQIEKGFLMITYEVVSNIKLRVVGKLMESPNLDEDSRLHELFDIFNGFVENLMIEKNESESYYIFTNGIIQQVLNENFSGGFYYKSAIINDQYNVALNTDLEENKLKISEVWYCERDNNKIKYVTKLL